MNYGYFGQVILKLDCPVRIVIMTWILLLYQINRMAVFTKKH